MPEDVEILVEEEFQRVVDKRWVKEVVRQVLKAEGVASPYEVSLVLTDSETVRRLNRHYRGMDETTDVLAFYMLTQKGVDSFFTPPPDGITHLGEVIISCPQAAAQAREQGHSLERELTLLIVHGILHLLGYNHEELQGEQTMRERERELLHRCSPEQ